MFYRICFFYGNDEFSLSDMTDAYKDEWFSSSDWLKLGFHSKEEWPDYPYVNADYSLVDENFKLIKKEIDRFAGEKSFALSVVPHWAPISRDGIRALYDNGIKVTYTTYEVYNTIVKTCKTIKDKETDMSFMDSAHAVLNLLNLSNIHSEFDRFLGQEYICVGNHEQYFYSNYFAYQPEYAEKILVIGEILSGAGYEFIFMEDLVK